MRKVLLTLLVALTGACAGGYKIMAYTITGQVIDRSDSGSLPYAGISIMKDSLTVLCSMSTDENGKFKIPGIEHLDVIIKVTSMGYATQKMVISGNGADLDVGVVAMEQSDVTLGEVTVYGSNVIEKADRYIIMPSQRELDRTSDTQNLLSNLVMKMPGLSVNEMMSSVKVEGRTPVFLINGKEEPFYKVQALNHKNILRIEYRNNPDIRYADRGASGIINFVMKPRQEGGNVLASFDASPMTGYINTQIAGSYYHKKSEWSLNYYNGWRDYDEQYVSVGEQYIGREETIVRRQNALPSSMSYFDNGLSLGYTYMYDINTMFATTARIGISTSESMLRNRVVEVVGNRLLEYDKQIKNQSEMVSPSMDFYFRKTINRKQMIEVNAAGTTSNGTYCRELLYAYPDSSRFGQDNKTHNDSWNINGELLYTRYYTDYTTRYGVNYTHNHRRNRYSENQSDESVSNLDNDNLYFYFDIAGKWRRLGYSIGLGVKYFNSSDDVKKRDYWRAKSTITINYRLASRWSLNYLFMYDPSLPSLSSLSDEAHTVDDIYVTMGNLNIKPSTWYRNRLYLRYQSEKFTSTLWGSYSRTDNPITTMVTYVSDPSSPYYNMFMSRVDNGKYDNLINLQLNLGWQNILDHFSIYAEVGYDDYRFVGKGYDSHSRKIYAEASAHIFWSDWSIYGNFEIIPRYSLSGNKMTRATRFNYIGVSYKWKNWHFKGMIANPFTRRGYITGSQVNSDVHPVIKENYIRDNANMVAVSAVYRVNFGASFKKAKRGLNGGSVDAGVDMNY